MSLEQHSDGVRVVLSAPQLAAVLGRHSIDSAEMASNRLWGGLQLVGGLLEMVGAGALCVMPEPTMASKAGCIAFGAHGIDTAAAGLRQMWTAQDTATLTQQGTTKLAEAMKASPDMANSIGLSLDIAVPFGFAGAIKAARVSRITVGRINLMAHEANTLKPGLGGHTLEKHVARTEAQLRERLELEPHLTRVSSFTNLERAEYAISEVMRAHTTRIRTWAASSGGGLPLTLMLHVAGDVGYGIVRQTGKLTMMNDVVVVLKYQTYNGMPYYILTAYVG
jgi:hypothetical protein